MNPWSTNAWSTEETEEITDDQVTSKWERHAASDDDSTGPLDVNLPPSWSDVSDSVWDTDNGTWALTDNNRPSWTPGWNSELPSQIIESNSKSLSVEVRHAFHPQTALPTPPSSPTPLASLPIPAEDIKLVRDNVQSQEQSGTLAIPNSFGSFEFAGGFSSTSKDLSWQTNFVSNTECLSNEPWRSNWNSPGVATTDSRPRDDWDVVLEAQSKLSENIPHERLQSIISQWEAIAQQSFSNYDPSGEYDYSWRKGLDNIVGLLERVDNLVPPSYFTLPISFPQSEIVKAVKESLLLTRAYALSQSSPMAQFFATNSSLEWENLVKMQTSAAKDEWGWDLKQEKEDYSETTEQVKGSERKSGLLSFWMRRTPADSATTAVANTFTQPQFSPIETKEGVLQPTSKGLEFDTDIPPTTSRTHDFELQRSQSSVLSRFLNHLSRRSLSETMVEAPEINSSLQITLSADDLAFLSDIDTQPTIAPKLPTAHNLSSSFKELAPASTLIKPKKEYSRSSLPPSPSLQVPGSFRVTSTRSDTADLLNNARPGSSPVDRRPYSKQNISLFEDILPSQDKTPALPRQRLSTSLDLLTAPSDASPSLKLQSLCALNSTSVTSAPPPASSQRDPSTSKVISSLEFDDFDDFVTNAPSPLTTIDMGDFGDFVSTPQLSHKLSEHVYSLAQVKDLSFQTSSSVVTPILKPPKSTGNRSGFDGNFGAEYQLRTPFPAGKVTPLLPSPSRRSLICPQSPPAINASLTAEASAGISTPKSTVSIVKSGLSAQDLSFFEGL